MAVTERGLGEKFMSTEMSEVFGRRISLLMVPDQLRGEKKRHRPQ
jgi:hypothetical protein